MSPATSVAGGVVQVACRVGRQQASQRLAEVPDADRHDDAMYRRLEPSTTPRPSLAPDLITPDPWSPIELRLNTISDGSGQERQVENPESPVGELAILMGVLLQILRFLTSYATMEP